MEKVFPLLTKSLPETSKRLIDNGGYYFNASLKGEAERYTGGKTSHTIHTWWARRPHNAMRPLVFASLAKKTNQVNIELMKNLSLFNNRPTDELSSIRSILDSDYESTPRLLDVFGGGGTIPQASASMGVDTYAIDINPLSVFIQKCYLEYFPRLNSEIDLIELVEDTGKSLLSKLKAETDQIYPSRFKNEKNTIAYLWTYADTCNNCNYKYLLSCRPWISKKISNKPTRGHFLAFQKIQSNNSQYVKIIDVDKKNSKDVKKSYKEQSVFNTKICPKCSQEIKEFNTKDMSDELLVKIINNGYGYGKSFKLADKKDIDPKLLKKIEKNLLNDLGIDPKLFPKIPNWSGITNPTLYGITSYFDFLNQRQRIVVLLLIKILDDMYKSLETKYNKNIARFVIGILSAFIDQLIDWNSRITMWISQNLQPGRSLSGPGIPMFWDYCEIDPLLDGPANLWGKLNRIIKGMKSITSVTKPANVLQGKAQSLEFKDKMFDAVVTDPPYYDNLYYSILADFIYSWKYHLFKDKGISVFSKCSTNNSSELVASKQRHNNDSILAHKFYSNQMAKALMEIERVLTTDGVLSFVYSHSSLKGWIAIIEAFSKTDLYISSIQPLTVERKARPRAMNAETVDTCIVFVARKNLKPKFCKITSVINEISSIGDAIYSLLEPLDWSESDIAMSIFANGVAMLANLKLNFSIDDLKSNLLQIESEIQSLIPSFKLKKRYSI